MYRYSFARSCTALFAALVTLVTSGCRDALERSELTEPIAGALDNWQVEESAAQWAGWRGAQRAGVQDRNSLSLEWNAVRGLDWKVDLPGTGNSSPVIWQDRIYLTASDGSSSLVVMCLDRRNGQLLWHSAAATAQGATHEKNGFASASVATDGEVVMAYFGSAGLFCYDTSGQLRWRAALGKLEHVWGTASSPILCGEMVIQLCDHQQDSFVIAFDKSTGEVVWRRDRPSYGSWSTPILVQSVSAAGEMRLELVINGTGTDDSEGGLVMAYDPANGNELWRVRGTTDIVCPTLIDGGGLLISTSGRNGPIIALRPGGSGDVTSTHVEWQHRRGGPYVPTGVAYRNRLYLVGDGGVAACYDLASGDKIWQQRLRGTFTASLVAGDGKIIAVSELGTVYVFKAADQFELLAEISLDERCLATPALIDGQIILRTSQHLYCVAAPTKLPTGDNESVGEVPDVLAEVESTESKHSIATLEANFSEEGGALLEGASAQD